MIKILGISKIQMKNFFLSISISLVVGIVLFFFPSNVFPMPFEVNLTFPGGHIQRFSQGFDYYFTPLSLDKSLAGKKVTINSITVSAIGKSDGRTINWDWEVHLGPTPFGFPVGQLRNTPVDPVSGYQKLAPTQLQFVIETYNALPGDYNFSGSYDFVSRNMVAKPRLSLLKNAITAPMDLKDGIYAQLFFWTGDPRDCSVTFRDVTMTVRGNIEELDGIKPSRYYIQMTNVDDVGSLYINGTMKYVSKWGFLGIEPIWVGIGHRPGDSGVIDITKDIIIGKNELKFELWNAPICCAASINILVKENDNVIFSDNFWKADSTEGIKYVKSCVINTTGSGISNPNDGDACNAPSGLGFDDNFTLTCAQRWKMAIYAKGILPQTNEFINFIDKKIEGKFHYYDVRTSSVAVGVALYNFQSILNGVSYQDATIDFYANLFKTYKLYNQFVLSYFVKSSIYADIAKVWSSLILSALSGDPNMAMAQQIYNSIDGILTKISTDKLKEMKYEGQISERYLTEFYQCGADTRKLAEKYSLPPDANEIDIIIRIADKYWGLKGGEVMFNDYEINNVLNKIISSENYVNAQYNEIKSVLIILDSK
jgi:hypothetical protein